MALTRSLTCFYTYMRLASFGMAYFVMVMASLGLIGILVLTVVYKELLFAQPKWVIGLIIGGPLFFKYLQLIGGGFLVHGTRQGYHCLSYLVAFLIINPLCVILEVCVVSGMFSSFNYFPSTTVGTLIFIVWVLTTGLHVLAEITVISFCQVVTKDRHDGPWSLPMKLNPMNTQL